MLHHGSIKVYLCSWLHGRLSYCSDCISVYNAIFLLKVFCKILANTEMKRSHLFTVTHCNILTQKVVATRTRQITTQLERLKGLVQSCTQSMIYQKVQIKYNMHAYNYIIIIQVITLIDRKGTRTVTSASSMFPYSGKKRYFSCSSLSITLCNRTNIHEYKAYWHMDFSFINGCSTRIRGYSFF